MTLAPRFLVTLWASLCARKYSRQMKELGNGAAAQQAALRQLLTRLAGTELGRRRHLHARMDYDEFRHTQPLVEHAHLAPLIKRVVAGEANILWPGGCRLFVETAGTVAGQPRLLPVTSEMLAHYRAGLEAAVFLYAARIRHTRAFRGRFLHAGRSVALHELDGARGASAGNLAALLHLSLSDWTRANLYAPANAIARLPDGPAKAETIASSQRADEVTLLGGLPDTARLVAEAALARAGGHQVRSANLQALWPNLECFLHTGAPLGLRTDELRTLLGPGVNFQEAYVAAEGWFAVQDAEPELGLRVLADSGIFYEFLPLRDYQPDLPSHLGHACVPLEQVKPGVDYVTVVTTPAGLIRYVPGDVVRFMSTAPPRLQFVGRAQLELTTFGERVTERELTATLLGICARHNWTAVNFHVAPLVRQPGPRPRGVHEWWIELRPGTVKTPTGPYLAGMLDAELASQNREYGARRQVHSLEAPEVRLVMPGVFDQWTRENATRPGAVRMSCCRSDRLIADQLAALTRFYSETKPPQASGRPAGGF
jgi:hypothetical protein